MATRENKDIEGFRTIRRWKAAEEADKKPDAADQQISSDQHQDVQDPSTIESTSEPKKQDKPDESNM
jgi:hypothetical protein